MEGHQLQITLEQREWDRLRKLSERNGETMESLIVKMVARELAGIFIQPLGEPLTDEVECLSGLFNNGSDYSSVEEKYFKNATPKRMIGETSFPGC